MSSSLTSSNQTATKRFRALYLPWLIYLIATALYSYEFILRIAPSVMTRQVMSAYHIGAGALGNLFTVFFYVYAPMQILVGVLIDRYGPRLWLTIAALVSSLGIYFYASSHMLWFADFGRLLIGFGSAFAFVGVLKLATIWLPPPRFALTVGLTMTVGVAGGIIGDLFLTALVDYVGWKITCYLLAIIGLLITLAVYTIIRDRNASQQHARNEFHVDGLKDLFNGILELCRLPQFWVNCVIGCLMYVPMTGFVESWQIPFLSQTVNFSHTQAAVAAAMVFLGWAVGAPSMAWLSEKIRQRRLPLTIGATLSAILISYVLYVPNQSRYTTMAILFVFGFFLGTQPITFSITRDLCRSKVIGTAIGLTNFVIMISGVSAFLIGALLDHFWKGAIMNGLRVYSTQNYQLALLVIPISLIISVFLTFFLQETYCQQKD